MKKHYPLLAIITAVTMWGLSFLSIKVTVAVLPPMTQALLRFIIASLVLLAMLLFDKTAVRPDKKDLPLLIVAGALGITLYFFFENNGMKRITASSASLIVATVPVLTILADAVAYKSRLSGRKWTSVLLSVLGTYFIVQSGLWGEGGTGDWAGYAMMFGATVAWVVYTLATKALFDKYSELVIVFYQTVFGTLLTIPFAMLEKTDWAAVTVPIALNLIFLGIFCSALATYFYVYAMDALGISLCSVIMNLVPVVAVTASCIILKEKVTLLQLFGGALVIGAVYICSEKAESNTIKKVAGEIS